MSGREWLVALAAFAAVGVSFSTLLHSLVVRLFDVRTAEQRERDRQWEER